MRIAGSASEASLGGDGQDAKPGQVRIDSRIVAGADFNRTRMRTGRNVFLVNGGGDLKINETASPHYDPACAPFAARMPGIRDRSSQGRRDARDIRGARRS
jgi:hypothetical protein